MSKGVLLIACGHPYYGNYAHQLAMSIKSVTPDVEVVCAFSDNGLNHVLTNNIFDKLIQIPKEYIYTNGLKDYLKSKVYLYDLSPFDETIFIDADVIWCPKKRITNLLTELKDVNFTCSNRGRIEIEKASDGFIHWAKPKEVMEKHNIKSGWLYNLASEFIYFKKCKEVKKLFTESKKIYEKPLVDYKRFGQSLPDELAFSIACIKSDIYPHAAPFVPFYWEHFEKKNSEPRHIYDNFYGYSIGGNTTSKTSATIYNNLAQHYSQKFGRPNFFPVMDKKSWLPERSQI